MRKFPLILLTFVVLAGGTAYISYYHFQNEKAYEQLALNFLSEEVLPRMRSGDLQVLSDWAIPVVEMKNGSMVNLENYIDTTFDIGPLTQVNAAEGGYITRAPWQASQEPSAEFQLQTTHTDGSASIFFNMIYRDEEWLITRCLIETDKTESILL